MAKKQPEHGKKPNQKIKPYVVLQYLMKYSDENNPQSAKEIIDFLNECGISAERRSIYRDIEEINKVALMLEEEIDIEEAEDMLFDDEEDDLKLVVYDKHKKGFYVKQRHFQPEDMRLLAECVYSAKFITEKQAKRLVDVVCDFVSYDQAEKIKHNAFLTDRVKTNNTAVINSITIINEAMSRRVQGLPHTPEKITFKYLKNTIKDVKQQVERRKGAEYKVSPYQLLINDGNYYLLAYDDYSQDMRTYRVDRMKDVSFTGEPRDGEEVFAAIDLKSYTQRVFSMFGGDQKMIRLRCINSLLDTVVDRFGTDAIYMNAENYHFEVHAKVEISDQFFGWVLGFGKKMKIIAPDDVVDQFKAYIDKIRSAY
jgi:predicted DNA-binding transcriptional regulator YafY